MQLKVIRIGNSLGVVLPREATSRLKVEKGDLLYLTDTPDGMRLTPHDPDFGRQIEVARQLAKKRRSALRELAK